MVNTPFTTLKADLKTQLETISGIKVYDHWPTRGGLPDKSVIITDLGPGAQPKPKNVDIRRCVSIMYQLDMLARSVSTVDTLADDVHEKIYSWSAHPENDIMNEGHLPWEQGRISSMHRRVFTVTLWTWVTKT